MFLLTVLVLRLGWQNRFSISSSFLDWSFQHCAEEMDIYLEVQFSYPMYTWKDHNLSRMSRRCIRILYIFILMMTYTLPEFPPCLFTQQINIPLTTFFLK